MFELGDATLLIVFVFAIVWWWRGYAVKEVALRATRQHCKELQVQLLDDSVVMRGLWLKRDARGSLCVRRSYMFEFTSTGDERYHGCAVMLGPQLESIQLQPHRLN
ncbi:MAG: hypothetical protein JWM78_2422 [Verrucomicrobiaceae bacterium]|nr:hypothetical protein [Verrucomicrobiaceae bacterium]